MEYEAVKKRVLEVIRKSTETEEEIGEDTQLYEDMGLASVEVYVMLCDLEEEFEIRKRFNHLMTSLMLKPYSKFYQAMYSAAIQI